MKLPVLALILFSLLHAADLPAKLKLSTTLQEGSIENVKEVIRDLTDGHTDAEVLKCAVNWATENKLNDLVDDLLKALNSLTGEKLPALAFSCDSEVIHFMLDSGALKTDSPSDLDSLFLLAVKNNFPEVAQRLLDLGADPMIDRAGYLDFCFLLGFDELVKLIIKHERFDLKDMVQKILGLACKAGNIEWLQFAFDNGGDPTKPDGKPMHYAVLGGNLDLLKILLAHPRIRHAPVHAALFIAIEKEREDIAEVLLEHSHYLVRDSKGFVLSLLDSSLHRLLSKVLKKNVFDEEDKEGITTILKVAMDKACMNGRTARVKALMASPLLPCDDDYLLTACNRGHLDTMELILSTWNLDPSDNNNELIVDASARGHAHIVELLLQDERVDPSARGNKAIRKACEYGLTDTVKLLLAHPKVDPSEYNQHALTMACLHGHAGVVEALLAHPAVDPCIDRQKCLYYACMYGYKRIAKLLLAHPLVDPAFDGHAALMRAIEGGYYQIIAAILRSVGYELAEATLERACEVANFTGQAYLTKFLRLDVESDSIEDLLKSSSSSSSSELELAVNKLHGNSEFELRSMVVGALIAFTFVAVYQNWSATIQLAVSL